MIQRIQSFWLVLAACCMALCFMMPVAEYHAAAATGQQYEAELNLLPKDNPEMMNQMLNGEPVVTFSQKVLGFSAWPLIVVAALTCVIAVVSIFMYKNRVRQMRVVSVGFLFNVVYVFLVFFWAVDAYRKAAAQAMAVPVESLDVTWFAGAYVPLASLLFFILARTAIRRDEAKVRAADRLR